MRSRNRKSKEKIIKVFKDCGLKTNIKDKMYVLSFLGSTFDLHKNTYELFMNRIVNRIILLYTLIKAI